MEFVICDSAIHGQGAFAVRNLPAGTRVVKYSGRKISKAESRRQCRLNNPFIFFLTDELDLDGNVESNPARFLNHSCSPNCEAECVSEEIWIVAKRDIGAGEELTFNYGYDLENYRQYPCRCGAGNCVGYIVAEEYHSLVRLEGASS